MALNLSIQPLLPDELDEAPCGILYAALTKIEAFIQDSFCTIPGCQCEPEPEDPFEKHSKSTIETLEAYHQRHPEITFNEAEFIAIDRVGLWVQEQTNPLMIAVGLKWPQVTRWLLDHGAKPDQRVLRNQPSLYEGLGLTLSPFCLLLYGVPGPRSAMPEYMMESWRQSHRQHQRQKRLAAECFEAMLIAGADLQSLPNPFDWKFESKLCRQCWAISQEDFRYNRHRFGHLLLAHFAPFCQDCQECEHTYSDSGLDGRSHNGHISHTWPALCHRSTIAFLALCARSGIKHLLPEVVQMKLIDALLIGANLCPINVTTLLTDESEETLFVSDQEDNGDQ